MSKEALTVAETAEMLNVSERWVRRHIDAGDLPVIRLGTHKNAPVRIPRHDLVAWVRAANPPATVQKAVLP